MASPPRSLGRRLRFQQLELLSEIADCGTLGEAAERLHVSRPAVSKSLRELENALGLALFERSARGMAPTAAGRRIVQHARLLLSEFRHLTEAATLAAPQAQGLLRIGMPPFIATHVAPGILARLRQQRPADRLLIQLREGRLASLVEQLLGGELDAVLTLYAPRAVDGLDLGTLAIEHLRVEPIVAVVAPTLKLPAGRRRDWAALAELPWILPPATTHLRRSVDDMFAAQGRRAPVPAIESPALAANVQLAVQGLGLAIVPASAAAQDIAAGRLRELRPQPPLPDTMVSLICRRVSALYLDGIAALREAALPPAAEPPASKR